VSIGSNAAANVIHRRGWIWLAHSHPRFELRVLIISNISSATCAFASVSDHIVVLGSGRSQAQWLIGMPAFSRIRFPKRMSKAHALYSSIAQASTYKGCNQIFCLSPAVQHLWCSSETMPPTSCTRICNTHFERSKHLAGCSHRQDRAGSRCFSCGYDFTRSMRKVRARCTDPG
jgi:hypothetical protein